MLTSRTKNQFEKKQILFFNLTYSNSAPSIVFSVVLFSRLTAAVE